MGRKIAASLLMAICAFVFAASFASCGQSSSEPLNEELTTPVPTEAALEDASMHETSSAEQKAL